MILIRSLFVYVLFVALMIQPASASGGGGGHGGGGSSHAAPKEVPEHLKDVPAFVTMDPLSIPVIQRRRGGRDKMFFQVVLEVKSPENLEKVTANKHRLQEGFFNYLYQVANSPRQLKLHDVEFVKKNLHAVTHNVVGLDTVSDVLILSSSTR